MLERTTSSLDKKRFADNRYSNWINELTHWQYVITHSNGIKSMQKYEISQHVLLETVNKTKWRKLQKSWNKIMKHKMEMQHISS